MRFVSEPKKPYYCEVEYLESTGTQYIDTDVYPTGDHRVLLYGSGYDGSGQKAFFGVQKTNERFCEFAIGSGDYIRSAYANYEPNWLENSFIANKNFLIDKNKNIVTYYDLDNNISRSNTVNYTSFISTLSMTLFCLNNGTAALYGSFKIKACKIYDANTLIRDFIPVLDWNMTPCMYDKVSEQFFYNQGSGSFNVGRQIHYVQYLESTGTQYINTGIIPTINTEFEQKIKISGSYLGSSSIFARWSEGPNYDTFGNNFNATNYCVIYYGRFSDGKTTSFKIDTQKEFVIKNMKTYVAINDNKTTVSRSSTGWDSSQYPIYLFGANLIGTPYGLTKVKMYYQKIWEDGVLVRNYFPAVDENGVGFLFDKVEHKIYDNVGTGAFQYPDIHLDYLESTGTQYINTGIIPTINTATEQKINVVAAGAKVLSFVRWSGYPTYDTFGTYLAGGNIVVYYGRYSDSKAMSFVFSVNTDYTIKNDISSITFNSTVKEVTREDVGWTNTTYPLYLFAGNNMGTPAYFSDTKIYYSKIWDNGILVQNLVPVLHNGEACMYDTVSKSYFTNQGTETFKFKIKELKSAPVRFIYTNGLRFIKDGV